MRRLRIRIRLRAVGPVTSGRQRGYSLYDLLTSIGVVGVLSAGVAGGLDPLLERQRLSTDVNVLVTHLAFARSEAIRRATPVTVCKSASGARCTPDSRWEQGWIVFVDADQDKERGADETVIRVQQALSAGHKLDLRASGVGPAASERNNGFTYYPTGQTPMNGTFTLCDRRGTAKTVILNRVGRARVSDRTSTGSKPQCR